MFIQPRRRRHSREPEFRSPALRHERVIALSAAAAVRIALAVAMAVAGREVFIVFRVHARDVPLSYRMVLPLLFFIGALLALRSGIRGIREAHAEATAPVATQARDDPEAD